MASFMVIIRNILPDFGQLYPGHFGAQILSVSVMIGQRDTYIKLPK